MRRRGAAAVEFALWMPLMLTLFAGVVDLSLYMNTTHTVVRAAREAARHASSTTFSQLTNTSSTTAIDAEIEASCEAHGLKVLEDSGHSCPSGCTVSCNWSTDATSATAGLSIDPEVIVVTVEEPYASVFNLLPFLSNANAAASFTMITVIQRDDVVP